MSGLSEDQGALQSWRASPIRARAATARAATSAGHRALRVGVRRPAPRRPGAIGMCATPDAGLDVLGLVDRAAGAHLHRRLVQRYGEHARSPPAPCGCWRRSVADRPGIMWSTIRSSACCRSSGSSTSRAVPDHDRGAVVHRVVEGRPPGDQAVELGHGHAHGRVRGAAAASRRRPSRGRRACRPSSGPSRSTAKAVGSTSGCPSTRRRGARPARRRGARCSAAPVVDRAVAAAGDAWCGRWARAGRARHATIVVDKWPVRTGHFPATSTGHYAATPAARPPRPRRPGAAAAPSSPTRSGSSVAGRHAGRRRPAAEQPRARRRPRRVARGGRAGLRPAASPRAGSRAGRAAGTFVAAGAAPASRRRSPQRRRRRPAALVRLDAGTPWIDPRHAAAWRRAWREVSTADAAARVRRPARPARAPRELLADTARPDPRPRRRPRRAWW